ncbi:CYFA0S12e00661g1_1 [Cyberlindnera fabianii]|uniref:CYFA0S12e00661g1_1 n=1 Tax=Cyberlindnera fabianii TaxID=36022 RepID=A0A061B6I5_CYBFA|nr:CYFA0S12e00661g1_1 [Cyberlindnera fabianii]
MDLRQLLNKHEEEGTRKRAPLAELSVNRAPIKRNKLNAGHKPLESVLNTLPKPSVQLPPPLQATSTPQKSGALTLPPISHLTSSIGAPPRVINTTIPAGSPPTPTTPSKPHHDLNNTSFVFLSHQNSNKTRAVEFNVTSLDDFQRADDSMDQSMDRTFASETRRRNKRKMLWSNEASMLAAQEFRRLFFSKKSSSFLKKEYQQISELLNATFGAGKFSETSVRNRKGFFQCLSHIYTSLRDHPKYGVKFNDQRVPILDESEWKEVSLYFEPSYLRKFRGKTNNDDLEVVQEIFKKRPMKRQDGSDDVLFKKEELQVVRRFVAMVQRGSMTLAEVTAVFVQSGDLSWTDCLLPHLDQSDENFYAIVKQHFDLSRNEGKEEVDLQRFWRMMNAIQGNDSKVSMQ